jgi:hypothetical protein
MQVGCFRRAFKPGKSAKSKYYTFEAILCHVIDTPSQYSLNE